MSRAIKEENGIILISTSTLCSILGVSRETVSNWEEQGCPKSARGWWPLGDVLKWRGLVGSNGPRTSTQADEMSLKEEKLKYETKLKQLQAESLELKNMINQGDYIKKHEIVNELSRFFVVLKRSLNGLSGKITTEVGHYVEPAVARIVEQQLKDTVDGCLYQMSIEGVYEPPRKIQTTRVAKTRIKKSKATRKT